MTRDELRKIRETYQLSSSMRVDSECFYKVVGAMEVLIDRLDALERGEYICRKCGLRKDGEVPGSVDF